jgi:hypothetical protein
VPPLEAVRQVINSGPMCSTPKSRCQIVDWFQTEILNVTTGEAKEIKKVNAWFQGFTVDGAERSLGEEK